MAGCSGDLTTDGDEFDEVGGDPGDVGEAGELGEADEAGTTVASMYAAISNGQYARVCNASSLNQRSGPSTNYGILRSMPQGTTVKILLLQSGWYKNDWGGRVGWSSGTYLCPVTNGGSGSTDGAGSAGQVPGSFEVTTLSRDNIIAVAKAAVGYSYFWGGAKFDTGSSKGACYGSCPSCNHSGSFGADCSGFVSKAWLLPEAMPMESNEHPYTTADFNGGGPDWTTVNRSNLVIGDAMVYRSGGAGHVLIYEKGDGWGSPWTYEARGCSYGVVHNLRNSLSSSYKGIRRSGL